MSWCLKETLTGCSDENEENWNPSDREKYADVEVDWTTEKRVHFDPEWDDENERKWELFRKPVIPEPDFEDIDYTPDPEKLLSKKFAESGLQVIVKIASIELTPDKPEFPVGGWHVSQLWKLIPTSRDLAF